jgi:hypothetical protein
MLRRAFLNLIVLGAAGAALVPGRSWASRQVTPMNVDRAFDEGAKFETEHYSGILRIRQTTELVVVSGQIIACDGLVWGAKPFAKQVAVGRYPVILTLAELTNGDQRVAFARVQFSPETPVRWEMAAPIGQDLSILKDGEIFGYPVDSGTGCFMDLVTLRALEAMPKSESNDFREKLMAEGQKNYVHTWEWVNMVVVPSTGANQVAFSSGFGDGYYASFWGYDANNEVVCLVTDFDLL